MMKRLTALLLALALLLAFPASFAEDGEDFADTDELSETEELDETEELSESEEPDEAGEPEETEEPLTVYDYEELVVGNPTHMDGKFFTGMWGNATSDIDVRTLVNSYYLTVWGYDIGLFRENKQTVSGAAITEDEEGNRNYMFVLCDDLFYSDGTPITAWDYAFSVLFQGAPVIAELGGIPMDLSYLEGFEEYAKGETNVLSGVHVVNDSIINFTVRHEYLPYFFELFRLGFLPYPIHEIAPGCKVYDDGEGVYIGNEDPAVTEQLFTKELLEATVMDPEEGYLSHPTVGSGPYVLTSWDGEEATFRINPYFKGNEEGYKPTIPHLRYKLAVNETMVSELAEGKFGLLNKVTRSDTILEGLALTGGQYQSQNYPRIGLTFLLFTPDRIALQEKAVRKAMAYCLEKEEVVRDYCGGFGIAMDGMIGLGQWMFQMVMGSLKYDPQIPEDATPEQLKEYEEIMAEWDTLNLDGLKHYDPNTEEAIRLLNEAGWTLNAEGKPYVPGQDAVRCKEIDGELVALDLKCAYPETNITAEALETLLLPHLADAGIRVTLIPMDMKTLLRSYNDRDIEDIDLFYLGDDFNIEFDPQLLFLPGDASEPEQDNLAWVHARMYDLAHDMCETEPHDPLTFIKKWIKFQEELSDYLPMIPVYSNIYFDFYPRELQNYDILYYITWGDAIVPATFEDYVEPEPEAEEGDEDEDAEGDGDDLEFAD